MSEQHIGVSDLRKFNASKLREFDGSEGVVVINEHAQPIAAMISYSAYMKIQKIVTALESANGMCRSAHSITKRNGKDTNWETFLRQLEKSLELQHAVMYPESHKDGAK